MRVAVDGSVIRLQGSICLIGSTFSIEFGESTSWPWQWWAWEWKHSDSIKQRWETELTRATWCDAWIVLTAHFTCQVAPWHSVLYILGCKSIQVDLWKKLIHINQIMFYILDLICNYFWSPKSRVYSMSDFIFMRDDNPRKNSQDKDNGTKERKLKSG